MWNLIIGGLFIIGGVSGHFALRGTDSPIALAAFGGILVVIGLIQLGSAAKESGGARGARRTVGRGGRGGRTTGRVVRGATRGSAAARRR